MKHLRFSSLEALLLRLAEDATAWPELLAHSPALLGYLARHGAWHLARVGRIPSTIEFLGRLLAFEERGVLMSVQQQTAALSDGLAAVGLCPRDQAAEVNGAALGELLLSVQDRRLLRPGCALLAGRSLDMIADAFAADPNPSAAAAYVVAEELARQVLAHEDREAWLDMARVGADPEHGAQYTALYAFKYVGGLRPDWLTPEILRPFLTGGPYDRLAVTTMLLHLGLSGHDFPARLDLPEFWQPLWRYNAEEIALVRGAMLFRGISAPADDDAQAAATQFRALEARRVRALAGLAEEEHALRSILEGYWRLTAQLDDLGRLGPSLRHHAVVDDLAWLLLCSPYWEVSEYGSALLARFASVDRAWEQRLLDWATGDDDLPWWGALVALRLLAERTGREESLFQALEIQSRSDSAQLRGNCANTLQTLIRSADRERRESLLVRFSGELRALLHGDDVWAVNELLLLLEGLEDDMERWAERLEADAAPLVRLTPGWRASGATEWGDLVTQVRLGTSPRDQNVRA
ncbi:MAG: hypothetical protein RL653_1007 [Pseudomonadota bacterium]|jgi:hypothetical protein